MKAKELLAKPQRERIRHHADKSDAALHRRLKDMIARFKKYFEAQRAAQLKKRGTLWWPYTLKVRDSEIRKLVAYLFELRRGETPTWMRGPWKVAPDGSEYRSQLPTSSDFEPMNHGEEFAALLRNYWQLAFGYTDNKTVIQGIASVIFQANEIDPLGAHLLLRPDAGQSYTQIASEVKPLAVQASRSLSPTVRTLKKTIEQRARDLAKPRRK